MMTDLYCYIKSLVNDERGQGMIEYALIIGLIAIVIMLALTPLGTAVKDMFDKIAAKLTGVAI